MAEAKVWDPVVISDEEFDGEFEGEYRPYDVNGVSVGYSENMNPNPEWREQDLICEYEHCIQNSPAIKELTSRSCFIFGCDCPSGQIQERCVTLNKLVRRLGVLRTERTEDVLCALFNLMRRLQAQSMTWMPIPPSKYDKDQADR